MYREYYPKGGKSSIIKKILLIGLPIAILISVGFYLLFPKINNYLERKELELQNNEVREEISKIKEEEEKNAIKIQSNILKSTSVSPIIKDKAYLEVPFICQAPYQTKENWVYHEESCEEAALLQVVDYLKGEKEVNRKEANQEILNMIEWQKKNLGGHHDLYGEDMKQFIMGYYGYTDQEVFVIKNATINDIKREISKGNPVIVPIMGNLLRNPYYPYPGYHMLTVIGYTEDKLITNDVGTMHGKDFSYSYDRFLKAMQAAGAEIIVIIPKNN